MGLEHRLPGEAAATGTAGVGDASFAAAADGGFATEEYRVCGGSTSDSPMLTQHEMNSGFYVSTPERRRRERLAAPRGAHATHTLEPADTAQAALHEPPPMDVIARDVCTIQ